MTTTTKTTHSVTHADGTVSTRTSKTRYEVAVEFVSDAEKCAAREERRAEALEREAAGYREVLADETLRVEYRERDDRVVLTRGFYLGDVRVASKIAGEPTLEEARATVESSLTYAEDVAARHRARAASIRAKGSESSVLRWSTRRALAEKYLQGADGRFWKSLGSLRIVDVEVAP